MPPKKKSPAKQGKAESAPEQESRRSRSQVAERDHRAFELRREGKNFDDIALELGFANKGSAYKAYARALARGRVADLSAADERELELARLDALQSAIWKDASRGDLTAVDKSLKIMARRHKLLGLDIAAHASGRSKQDANGDPSGVVVGRDRLDEIREKRKRDAAHRSSGA